MRFDMHCHTKEGSPDCKIPLIRYVSLLKEKGYHGMLLTDHNSYKAYRYYQIYKKHPAFKDFTVLKGVEYDTCDSGHILVIMPENINLPLLELRGMSVSALIRLVHFFGGILGPAHPCGEKYMSLCSTQYYKNNPSILKEFDFMETFNACETDSVNLKATTLAAQYHLPGIGGSDSHKVESIGCAYTDLPDYIFSESALIDHIRKKTPTCCGGHHFPHTLRDRIGRLNNLFVYSFWLYNKTGSLLYRRRRNLATPKNFL
ncbi:MAG: PHP domain-containing protein [Lachnospiraceae bacterium]|nr:PHP domain-containing protein [Lachnospiraceae bacterium]